MPVRGGTIENVLYVLVQKVPALHEFGRGRLYLAQVLLETRIAFFDGKPWILARLSLNAVAAKGM